MRSGVRPANLWDVVVQGARAISVSAHCLGYVGARITTFFENIDAHKYHEIELQRVGIPEDAAILQVGYTPQGGGVFPIELHGNTPLRRIAGTTLRLLGMPMEGAGTHSSRVVISTVWVPNRQEAGWPYLLDGFDAIVSRNYDRVIVPAQSPWSLR